MVHQIPRIPVDIHLLGCAHSAEIQTVFADAEIEGEADGVPGGVVVADELLAVGPVTDVGKGIALRQGLGVDGFPAGIGSLVLLHFNGPVRAYGIVLNFQRRAGGHALGHGQNVHIGVLYGQHGVKALPSVHPEQQPQSGTGGHHSGRLTVYGLLSPGAAVVGRLAEIGAGIIAEGGHIGDAAVAIGVIDGDGIYRAHTVYAVPIRNLLGIPDVPGRTVFTEEGKGQPVPEADAFGHGLQIGGRIVREQSGVVALRLIVPADGCAALLGNLQRGLPAGHRYSGGLAGRGEDTLNGVAGGNAVGDQRPGVAPIAQVLCGPVNGRTAGENIARAGRLRIAVGQYIFVLRVVRPGNGGGDILVPGIGHVNAGVCYRGAAYQQQGRGNDGGNQQEPWPGPLCGHLRGLQAGAFQAADGKKQNFRFFHSAYPSCVRCAFSFFRVRLRLWLTASRLRP